MPQLMAMAHPLSLLSRQLQQMTTLLVMVVPLEYFCITLIRLMFLCKHKCSLDLQRCAAGKHSERMLLTLSRNYLVSCAVVWTAQAILGFGRMLMPYLLRLVLLVARTT